MIDYIPFYDPIKNKKIAKKIKDIFNSLQEDQEFGFDLPKLPYSFSALEPVIDATTMKIHHGKHHKKYVDKMNELLGKTDKSLIELLQNPKDVKDKESFLDNAGGHFNHSYFWITMSPEMNQKPSGKLAKDIDEQFGSLDNFKKEFIDAGVKHFGSGWVWLCVNDGKLKVSSFKNQSNPYIEKCGVPLLGCDVWEHAYYLKYQNNREKYITTWFKVVNWNYISKKYNGE
jgi:Fe-Mn family superoxide dismutase